MRQRQFFHDARTSRLDSVIRAVLINPLELNTTYEQVVARLTGSPDYCRWFSQFYRQLPSEQTINQALIAYLHSLSPTPPVSRVRAATRPGQVLFVQSGCPTCHPAPDYRDRHRHEVTAGRWVRTPTLRNLALTLPYLNDGTAPTIEAVLKHPFRARQHQLTPTEIRQLIDFLTAIPLDTSSLTQRLPLDLPDIPGAPTRRIGGTY